MSGSLTANSHHQRNPPRRSRSTSSPRAARHSRCSRCSRPSQRDWALMFLLSRRRADRRRRRRHARAAPAMSPSGCRAGRATRSTWWSTSPPMCSCRPIAIACERAAAAPCSRVPAGDRDRRDRRALFRRPQHEDRRTTTSAASRRYGTWWRSICSCCGPQPWIAAVGVAVLAVADVRAGSDSCIRSGCGGCARSRSRCLSLWAALALAALLQRPDAGPVDRRWHCAPSRSISSASDCCGAPSRT